MDSSTWWVLGAAAVVGGGILYLRSRTTTPPAATTCDRVAALAATAAGIAGSDPESARKAALAGCKAAGAISEIGQAVVDGVYHALGGNTLLEKLAANVKLNGPVVESVDPHLPSGATMIGTGKGNFGTKVDTRAGAVARNAPLKHENGCVPYTNAAGSEKCAKGTFGLKPGNYGKNVGTGSVAPNSNDPFSFAHPRGEPYPVELGPTDKPYWINGKPVVCKGDQVIATDHRGGTPVGACVTNYAPPTPPRGGINDQHDDSVRADGTQVRDHR